MYNLGALYNYLIIYQIGLIMCIYSTYKMKVSSILTSSL